MKFIAISDLHGYLPVITEKANIMFICGDISPLNIQRNHPRMDAWMKNTFVRWINNLDVETVYLVAGNHDICFENRDNLWKDIQKLTNYKLVYLENDLVYYDDGNKRWSIFGTPYCHIFGNWAFMLDDNSLAKLYAQMPDNVDFIISHDCPYNIGDTVEGREEHIGNIPLADKLSKTKFMYNVHGHLHTSDHNIITLNNGGKVVNTSLVNEQYEMAFKPLVIEC